MCGFRRDPMESHLKVWRVCVGGGKREVGAQNADGLKASMRQNNLDFSIGVGWGSGLIFSGLDTIWVDFLQHSTIQENKITYVAVFVSI